VKIRYTILFALFSLHLLAQQEVEDPKREIKYSLEAGTYLSTSGTTPFWLRANRYGIVPLESNFFTLRGSVSSDYKKANSKEGNYKLSKFDWGYGLNVVGNVGKQSELLIPEAYVKAKYGKFEIYAGRRKEIVGLVDTALTSGSYIWSGNALPMPKIQISNPDYVPLGVTNGLLSFKGSFAHGWFENNRTDVKSFYLHQKSLYFRLGKPNWKFKFYGGFNHQVQWGGVLLYSDPNNLSGVGGIVGSSFSDYIGAVTGKSLATLGDSTKIGQNDATNRGGNHLGTIDIGVEIGIRDTKVLLYRQSIYEDGSLAYLNNISDGLNGISFTFTPKNEKKIKVNKIVFEYLNTMSQGGIAGSDLTNARLRGQDNYFLNGVYLNGWTSCGNTLGHPLLTRGQWVNGIYNENIFNSRVEMVYVGTTFYVNKVLTQFSIVSSRNIGAYAYPISVNTFSLNGSSLFLLKSNLRLRTAIAFDAQDSKGNLGCNVSVLWNR
jgi:hypothetical protein